MKKSEKTGLRQQSVEDLQGLAKAKREELLKGRINGVMEGAGLGMQGRKLRREIARIETIITEKQRGQQAAEQKATA